MADIVNQAVMQARKAQGDAPGQAIAVNAAAIRQMAQQRINQQQSRQAQDQREFNQDMTVMGLDWVPVEDKVRIANKRVDILNSDAAFGNIQLLP